MNYSGDASSDPDKDSEFDSREEDVEFQLYEQLYFEPNSDITESNVKSDFSNNEEVRMEKISETDKTQFVQTKALKADDHRNIPEGATLAAPNTTASTFQTNKNYELEKYIFIDTLEGSELPLPTFTTDLSLQDKQIEPTKQQTRLTGTAHKISFHTDVPPMKNALSSHSARQRLSSTCSDGSIPGSIPLDNLYCNMVTSDEEGADDGSIKEKLMMKNLKVDDHGKNKESITAESTKRKRTKSSSDEMEDSRCNNLISVTSKNSSGKSEVYHLNDDSNSDEDLYVLPPPVAVNPEVLTLDSSSASEPEVLTKNVSRVKKQNNKYQKVEKTDTSSLTRQRKALVRRKSRDKDSEVHESETDSNDVDFPEATKGTDLTLNIDRSLSGLVKTISKDPKVKTSTKLSPFKKAKKSTKNFYGKSNLSSVDFTRGRPDTMTKPSCEKWTQSMVNFYDSDISDDIDVSEIHQQQSGSQADWHLVLADYQITQRRRYYNAPERCKLCRQEGHTSKECPRIPKCHLCSGTDHIGRNNCPENCCFKCGEEPHFFCHNTGRRHICALCGYPGHSKDLCPDLWRRFHVTTTGIIAQTPSEYYSKPPREQCCYVCTEKGHYGHECPLRYNNLAYSQVPQSVVSYSSPVNLVNGYFVVNTEGAQAPLPEENMTKMLIKSDQTGRIIGRKGVVVKAISKESGAQVRVISEGQPQVLLFGPSEARLKAQEIIRILLGQKNNEKYADFLEHLRAVNRSDSVDDQRKNKRKSSTPEAGIKSSSHTTSGLSTASSPLVITINDSAPTAHDISRTTVTAGTSDSTATIDASERTPVIAGTSESRSTVSVSESNQNHWCEDFLITLDRNKESVLKKIKEIMASLVRDERQVNLGCALRYLRKFKAKRKLKPSLEPNRALKRHMKKIAMAVIGREKFGDGNRIYSEMGNLMKEVQVYQGRTIPEDICIKIAKTLECLHEPPVEKLDQLIEYGEKITPKRKKKYKKKKKLKTQNENEQSRNNKEKNAKKTRYRNKQSRNNKKSNAKVNKEIKIKHFHTNV